MNKIEKENSKYIKLAKQAGMLDALIIKPSDIIFDIRANLKCAWGCERGLTTSIKCSDRDTTYQERVQMVKQYKTILLLHSHDAHQLSRAILRLERAAFLDGNYFALALRYCNYCAVCQVDKGQECPHPEKVRPCDQLFGIDAYKTVRQLGLPCEVLQTEEDTQNRYGFLLIN